MPVLRYLGLAEEASYNPAQPPAAVIHVDIASATLDAPSDTEIVFAGGLTRSPRLKRPGYYAPTGNIALPFDVATIAWLLKAALGGYEFSAGITPAVEEEQTLYLGGATGGTFVLGDGVNLTTPIAWNANAATIETALDALYGAGNVTVAADTNFTVAFATSVGHSHLEAYFGSLTGDVAPLLTLTQAYQGVLNRHECWGSNDTYLPSLNMRLGRDLLEHVFAGCTLGTLDLAVEGELAMATLGVSAARDLYAALETSVEGLLLPAEYPLAFHEFQAYLVGEGPLGADMNISARVRQFTLPINNGLAADLGRTIGSRYPRRLPVQEREVKFTANLEFEDLDHLFRLWGSETGPAVGGSTEFGIRLVGTAGGHGSINILIPRMFWTQVQQPVAGRTLITQAVTGRAMLSTVTLADAITEVETDILATILNAHAEIVPTM